MAIEDYLEHLEGPDGQFVDLLTRLPYDRARIVERVAMDSGNASDLFDGCLKAHAWTGRVTDYLTGEEAGMQFERGDPAIVNPWRERAVELYNAWYETAMPGPKGSSQKRAKRTPTT